MSINFILKNKINKSMRTSCNFKLENEHSGFFAGPFVRDLRAEKATDVDLKERGDANL